MECLSPMSIRRPGTDAFGRSNKSNDRITVPCGKCAGCLSNLRNDWTFRIKQELRQASTAYFITLTYNDENIPYVMPDGETSTLKKRDLQLFIKRLRRFHDSEVHKYQALTENALEAKQIRYFAVGEYGGETLRPHYHGIFFNISENVFKPYPEEIYKKEPEKKGKCPIDLLWTLGFYVIGDVNDASIHYVTKYVINRKFGAVGVEAPFSVMSRRPGLGSDYVTANILAYHRQEKGMKFEVTNVGGRKQRMPRYYKEKIFTKNELKSYKTKIETEMDDNFDDDIASLYCHGDDLGKVILEQKLEAERRVIDKIKNTQKL